MLKSIIVHDSKLLIMFITELSIGERSASGAAWALLKALVGDTTIESNNKVESRSSILHAVASRLLSVGVFLPHWLLSEYKVCTLQTLYVCWKWDFFKGNFFRR